MDTRKTRKGYDIGKILELMTTPLPDAAFKTHPTKKYLTTISPDFSRERLTKIFGLFGIGWGLRWDTANTKIWETVTSTGKPRYNFALLQAEFWFILGDDTISFPVTGFSDNDNLGDAMEGARTNAVSAGAKQLLFQIHIYKNTPAKPITAGDTQPPTKAANGKEPPPANAEDLLKVINNRVQVPFNDEVHLKNAIRKVLEDDKWGWPAPKNVEGWRSAYTIAKKYADDKLTEPLFPDEE